MGYRRTSSRAFTLVELLVVIGIIALLIGIIMPSLSRAREASKRTVCASNLRQIGIAAHSFAASHKGYFPMSFGTGTPPSLGQAPVADMGRLPTLINRTDWIANSETDWKRYGTPWSIWQQYGALLGVWKCPGSEFDVRFYNGPDGIAADPAWGEIVYTDYAYVGGLVNNAAMLGKSVARWGTLYVPAVRSHSRNSTELILAADAVYYSAGTGRKYHINHQSPSRAGEVDRQAILYADGHVTDFGPEMYEGPLQNLRGRSTLQFDNRSGNGYTFFGLLPVPPPAPPPTTPPAPTPPAPPAPPPPPNNLPNPLP